MEDFCASKAALQPYGAYGTGFWRSIRNLWPKLINHCKIKVGNVEQICFLGGLADFVLGGLLGGARLFKSQFP